MSKDIKRTKGIRGIGIGLSVVIIICVLFLLGMIIKLNMLPMKYLILAAVVMGILCGIDAYLLCKKNGYISFIVGAFLCIIGVLICAVGGMWVMKTRNTILKMTSAKVETTNVSVYVLNNSPITDISEIKEQSIGILGAMDRENTDLAIDQLKKNLGAELNFEEYNGLGELADSLRNSNINVILLNEGYLDVYRESEGYETFPDEIRSISVQEIVTDVEDAKSEKELDMDNPFFAVYISGNDTFGPVSTKTRSDVNIIAFVNMSSKQILLVSTPRDYYVPLSISNGVKDKLTHAGIYGVDVSRETLEMIYGQEIDYHFRLNFTGFKRIIDELGGVTVDSDYDFSTPNYSFSQGENFVDGDMALEFARERYSFTSGDNQRGRNQMKVITAVINKAMSPAILKNYSSIMESLNGTFETSLSYNSISTLVKMQLNNNSKWNIVSYSVTGFDSSTNSTFTMSSPGIYVMEPDNASIEVAKDLIKQVKDGKVIEAPAIPEEQ